MSLWWNVFAIAISVAYCDQKSAQTRNSIVKTVKPLECNPHKIYYSYDGRCNNLKNPTWGRAGNQFSRYAPANYSSAKGLECLLRRSMIGRTHSRNIKKLVDSKLYFHNYSNIYFAFNEWLDYDIGKFRRMHNANYSGTCCKTAQGIDFQFEKDCLPMIIPKLDEFYSHFNVTCIDLLRASDPRILSNKNLPTDCSPINSQTAFLDLSILYGSNSHSVKEMRLFKNGKLKCPDDKSPTIKKNYQSIFSIVSFIRNCVEHGGDCSKIDFEKKDQNPELMLMGALFRMIHNTFASYYKERHNDETIFKKTRRYLIAIYQHIIFNEYIPVTIGLETARTYDLLQNPAFKYHHIPEINPQTPVEYSFASRYFIRKLTRVTKRLKNDPGKNSSHKHQEKVYHLNCNADDDLRTLIEEIMGLKEKVPKKKHPKHQEKIKQMIKDFYSISDSSYGTHLIAVDTLRGLDVGLPTYNEMRKILNFKRLNKFEDLKLEFTDDESVQVLKKLYATVDDIDLYVGGLLEKHSLIHPSMGRTFLGIFKETFYRLKFGDRLYYEFPSAKFTERELIEIRKVTFSYLICLTEPHKNVFIAQNAFLKPSYNNPLYPCRYILRRGPKLPLF